MEKTLADELARDMVQNLTDSMANPEAADAKVSEREKQFHPPESNVKDD